MGFTNAPPISLTTVTVKLATTTTVKLASGTEVTLSTGAKVALVEGTTVALATGSEVTLATGTEVKLATGSEVKLKTSSVSLADGSAVAVANTKGQLLLHGNARALVVDKTIDAATVPTGRAVVTLPASATLPRFSALSIAIHVAKTVTAYCATFGGIDTDVEGAFPSLTVCALTLQNPATTAAGRNYTCILPVFATPPFKGTVPLPGASTAIGIVLSKAANVQVAVTGIAGQHGIALRPDGRCYPLGTLTAAVDATCPAKPALRYLVSGISTPVLTSRQILVTIGGKPTAYTSNAQMPPQGILCDVDTAVFLTNSTTVLFDLVV